MRKNPDRHLEHVIHLSIRMAERAGENFAAQNEAAMRSVRWMKPDMTASEALENVNLVRRKSLDFIM